MPWGLGIWVFVRGSRLWLRWVVAGRGHACGRRVVPGDGRFHGPASWRPGAVSGVCAGQAGVFARVMTAAAIRVAVSARPARGKVLAHLALRARCRFRSMTVRCFASSLVSAVQLVLPGADRGGHGAAGAAVGDLAGLDALPGAASLLRGGGGERGGAGDAPGHLVPGGPGGEFLPDQARAARAEHRPGRRPGAAQARLRLPQRGREVGPRARCRCRHRSFPAGPLPHPACGSRTSPSRPGPSEA